MASFGLATDFWEFWEDMPTDASSVKGALSVIYTADSYLVCQLKSDGVVKSITGPF